MKKTISIIMAFAIIISMTTVSFAQSNSTAPNYHTVCGTRPYHEMVAHGWGSCRLPDGTDYITNGAFWQCRNCNLAMVTEGDIYFNEMSTIGKWGEASWYEPVTSFVVVVHASNWGYCESSSMNGYRFYLNS